MTALNAAVAAEDYRKAAELKKRLDALSGTTLRGDFAAYGLPSWLHGRLKDLGMRFPTPIQARTLREAFGSATQATDVLIRSPTGSGKTLAYTTASLAAISNDLEDRERLTTLSVANAGLLTPAAAMEALSPALRTSARTSVTRIASLAAPRGPPLFLVLTPSRALAVQIATAIFTLVGGNARSTYFPGDKKSLFSYTGPKGVRVCCLASDADADRAVYAARTRRVANQYENQDTDSDEIRFDDLHDCDILVADSDTLINSLHAATAHAPLFNASRLRVLAIDEADAYAKQAAEIIKLIQCPQSTRRILVGATLNTPALSELLEKDRSAALVEPPPREESTSTIGLNVVSDEASLSENKVIAERLAKVPLTAGLSHRFLAVENYRRLGVLVKLMRSDLQAWNESSQQLPRPRCIIFCVDETTAALTAKRLRAALWGDHAIAALLPNLGKAPVEAAQALTVGADTDDDFAAVASRAGATVLVTSANAARGLDFPQVTHVFILGVSTSIEYAHMAGRTGRVGQKNKGVVTTLANENDIVQLKQLFANDFPNFSLLQMNEPSRYISDDQSNTQQLEDLILLYDEDGSAADTTPLRPRPIEDDGDSQSSF
uniref:ATP-dependent RNA helicase n=1 Tax=Aureoumbra lagunensis TaxID=44058 RepID=A0A7S3JTV7_9STRA